MRFEKKSKNRYPLRKVVERNVSGEYFGIQYSRLHLLSCGHKVPPSTDMYGEIGSTSQRCRLCYEDEQKKLKTDQ